MTVLVLAGNALLMFVGWEGVGLASYLLIGFWFPNPPRPTRARRPSSSTASATSASSSACFCCWPTSARSPSPRSPQSSPPTPAGRAACSPHRALPAARRNRQERAASALHLAARRDGRPHARLRAHPRGHHGHGRRLHDRPHPCPLRPLALRACVVAIIGAATALFAATIALVQNDIKRVLAYSTISQLGYMFLGCGVAAYSAAIFHLMTHAFFKALLFLAAGSVIHAMGGEQDLRKMGGLRKKLPSRSGP
jgi:NADH-quinone oxidoreductase subunit L